MQPDPTSARWLRLVLLFVTATALLTGCGAPEEHQAAAPAAITEASQMALAPSGPTLGSLRQGDLLAWLSSDPARPVQGEAAIAAYLVGIDGQPIADAKVTFDTDMTNMSHGPYLVEAQPVGNGQYVARVHFSMPGPWRVIAIVERPGQEVARLRFRFSVTNN
jgi:hypothetical protein